jgi:tetratricopeptide (TPR) repeat protein
MSFVTCLKAASEPGGAAFDSANKLYEQGKFAEAASAYEKMAQTRQASAAVYYNLGNAFFKAGQIGRAIAAYNAAEKITPRDPDLRANLQFARNQVQGPTHTQPAWQRWLTKISLNEWAVLAAALLWIWFLLLILLQWRPSLKPSLRLYVAVLGIAVLVVCACVVIVWRGNQPGEAGVVVTREAVVRQGPLDESQTAFTLHDGAEIQVLDRKDDWLQVTTDPRRIGWVHRDQVL